MFCLRTKRNKFQRPTMLSHEAVECFSTQKFIFLLTDSFPFKHWSMVWLNSLFLKIPVLLWDADKAKPSFNDQDLSNCFNQCWKCTPTNHPPSMNSHRGYNITGKFARLKIHFHWSSLVLFSQSFKAIMLLTYEIAIRIKFLNIVKSLTVAV